MDLSNASLSALGGTVASDLAALLRPSTWRAAFSGDGSFFDMGERYPEVRPDGSTSIPGVYLAGNIAGYPDIKAALNTGTRAARSVAERLSREESSSSDEPAVVIVGGGPAGVSAALELQRRQVSYVLLERRELFATLRTFKPDLELFVARTGESSAAPPLGFGDATAKETLARWQQVLAEHPLRVETKVEVVRVHRAGTHLSVETKAGHTYTPRAVIIAVGKLVLLDKLAVRDQTGLDPSLAQTIAGGPGVPPVSKENLSRTTLDADGLLRGTPLRYERDLTLGRALFLAVWAAVVVWLYLAKSGVFFGDPLARATAFLRDPSSPLAVRGSFEEALTFFGWKGLWLYARNLSLGSFYPLLYSAVVLVFGVRAARRWGDGLQRRKYALLIGSQVFLYFLLPELILRPLLGYGYWFGYTLAYPWPLVVSPKTLSAMIDPNQWPPASLSQLVTSGNFYVLWALFISFVVLPVGVLFHGKRFCSWVCGCGALAETLGDPWRHFRPAGEKNRARERQILYALAIVFLLSLATSAAAVFGARGSALWQAGNWARVGYSVGFDLLAVSIIPVVLYPVLGGKLWCRYWCPTAGFMHLVSAFFRKKNRSRTAIVSKKERCIACGHCTRYCEVGIDVRAFALKGKVLDNLASSCIGCGTCVSVCPTGVLGFSDPRGLPAGASKVAPEVDKAEPERIGA